MPKQVLIITYYFPPVGGAGVQRVTKFVRYLPQHGWQPSVLTVSNPSVPLFDHSLEAEIPAHTAVHRTRTLEPGYEAKHSISAAAESGGRGKGLLTALKKGLRHVASMVLQPDPQILWLPSAYLKGRALLKQQHFDAILVTAPPFSPFLLGALLSKRSGLPLLLDFRDEWDISQSTWENKKATGFSNFLQQRMQRYVVKQASGLIATTGRSAQSLARIASTLQPSPAVDCIYNGYDSSDFQGQGQDQASTAAAVSDKYCLSYIGTLWNLTSIEPVVEALLALSARRPDLAARIRFSVAGRSTGEQSALLERLAGSAVELVRHPYLPHADAIRLMRESHGLCLLLSNYPYASRVVPAKTFEYLACRKSIFNISPEGEVWEILRGYPRAFSFAPTDVEGLIRCLERQVEDFSQHREVSLEGYDFSRFERLNQSLQLARLLDSVSSAPQEKGEPASA